MSKNFASGEIGPSRCSDTFCGSAVPSSMWPRGCRRRHSAYDAAYVALACNWARSCGHATGRWREMSAAPYRFGSWSERDTKVRGGGGREYGEHLFGTLEAALSH